MAGEDGRIEHLGARISASGSKYGDNEYLPVWCSDFMKAGFRGRQSSLGVARLLSKRREGACATEPQLVRTLPDPPLRVSPDSLLRFLMVSETKSRVRVSPMRLRTPLPRRR
jgi:hypothetical protein